MKPFLILLMRIFVGAVFMYSGWEKLMAPVENFMAVIDQYRFLPLEVARPTALVVPWLELVLGTFLVVGFMTRVSATGVMVFLGVFIVLLGRSILLELPIADCGCFGSGISLAPHQALMLDTALLLCTVLVFTQPPSRLSLDRRLTALVVLLALSWTGCVRSGVPVTSNVVARIGGEVIDMEELDQSAAGRLKSLEQEIYDLKRERLEEMVEEKLWQLEARERGITPEALKKSVAPDQKSFRTDLAKKYPIELHLSPPRQTIHLGETPLAGRSDAPVTVVEFSDFECPFCGRAQAAVREIQSRYPDTVRLAFKHFPLPFHRNARQAHLAALCAEEQGKFWPYRTHLFQHQKDLSKTALLGYAHELGFHMDSFESCLEEERYAATLERHFEEAQELGVTGTPTFFVNGRRLSGAQPFQAFERIIEEELQGKR